MSQIKKLASSLLYPVKAGYRVGFCVFWNSFPFIILIFISTMVFLSCADDEPLQDTTPPGRRDYTWTQETLKTNPGDLVYLTSLWGSSLTDIWAVGHGVSSDLCIWHYDGLQWNRDNSRLSSNFIRVFGINKNNVWICGEGKPWKYDGVHWEQKGNYIPNFSRIAYSCIWGSTSDDLYAIGIAENESSLTYRGLIQHWNGREFGDVSIPEMRVVFNDIKRLKNNSKYYLTATRYESKGDTEKVFEYDGSILREIYTGFYPIAMGEVNNELFFTNRSQIYIYNGVSFVVWKDFQSMGYTVGALRGRTLKDIFFLSASGNEIQVVHFNGDDLKVMIQVRGLIFDFFLFEKDIFILAHDWKNPIIFHGKLEN